MTREEWLRDVANAMAATFDDIGHALPAFRVTCGWPSHKPLAEKGRTIGECWSSDNSDDRHCEIFVSPSEDDEFRVAMILAHELVHAQVGNDAGHGPTLQKVARKLGFTKPFTSFHEGEPRLTTWIKRLTTNAGPYPHAKLDGSPHRKKKQSTRMIKAECFECGYTVRLTRKWLTEVGAPHCPNHGAMEADHEDE